MNNLNEFLKKLGIGPNDYENSPMDMLAPDDAPINQVPAMEDEYADMPAIEGGVDEPEQLGSRTKLASDAHIAKIQAIPLPESQQARMPQAAAIPELQPQEDPKISKYKQLLDEYKSKNTGLAMLQGGNQIAQAIASGYGGKIGDGSDSVKMLQGQLQDPLKEIQSEDAATMADPNSDVSKMYREQAYAVLAKLNPKKDYSGQLENMSASQLLKLPGVKNSLGGSKMNSREIRIQEPDGTVRSKVINLDTGELIKDLGLSGYAYGTQIDPRTGEAVRVSKADPNQKAVTPGGSKLGAENSTLLDKKEKKQPLSPYDVKQSLNKYERDILDKEVNQFQTDIKDEKRIISEIGAISDSSLDLARKNPNAAKTIGAQIAKIMQGSRLTDADVKLYTGQEGVLNQLKDFTTEALTGTISDEKARNIKQVLATYNSALRKALDNRANQAAEITLQNFDPKMGLTSEDVAPLFYIADTPGAASKPGLTSNNTDLVSVKGPSGQIAKMTRENAKKYLSQPGYQEVK